MDVAVAVAIALCHVISSSPHPHPSQNFPTCPFRDPHPFPTPKPTLVAVVAVIILHISWTEPPSFPTQRSTFAGASRPVAHLGQAYGPLSLSPFRQQLLCGLLVHLHPILRRGPLPHPRRQHLRSHLQRSTGPASSALLGTVYSWRRGSPLVGSKRMQPSMAWHPIGPSDARDPPKQGRRGSAGLLLLRRVLRVRCAHG